MVYEGSEHFLHSCVGIVLNRTNSSSTPAYQGEVLKKVLDSFSCIKFKTKQIFCFFASSVK